MLVLRIEPQWLCLAGISENFAVTWRLERVWCGPRECILLKTRPSFASDTKSTYRLIRRMGKKVQSEL